MDTVCSELASILVLMIYLIKDNWDKIDTWSRDWPTMKPIKYLLATIILFLIACEKIDYEQISPDSFNDSISAVWLQRSAR